MFKLKNEKLIEKIKFATGLNPDFILESERLFHLYFNKNKTSTSYTKKAIGVMLNECTAKRIIVTNKAILSDTFASKEGLMGAGKLSTQVGHAIEALNLKKLRNGVDYKDFSPPTIEYQLSMNIKPSTAMKDYTEGSFTKIILTTKNENKMLSLYEELSSNNIECVLIQDIGFTVFNNVPTYTCVGIEPMYSYIIDCFTKRLQLLK